MTIRPPGRSAAKQLASARGASVNHWNAELQKTASNCPGMSSSSATPVTNSMPSGAACRASAIISGEGSMPTTRPSVSTRISCARCPVPHPRSSTSSVRSMRSIQNSRSAADFCAVAVCR